MTDFIQVAGHRELRAALRRLDVDLAKEVKEANREGAEVIARAARPKVPQLSGRLAKSLRVGATQKAGVVRLGRSSVPYAAPIHFGWHRRNIRPNPVLYDALDSRRSQVVDVFNERIADICRRADTNGS